jgi:protein-L-isoaspartate(D-aspartate) O-methyltransferase
MTCPECGFDFDAERPCAVCGYDAGLGAIVPARRPRRVLVPVLSAVLLLGVIVWMFVLLESPGRPPVQAALPGAAPASPQPTQPVQPAEIPQAPAAPEAPAAATDEPAPVIAAAARPSAPSQKVLLNPEAGGFELLGREIHPPMTDAESFVTWMQQRTGQKTRHLRGRWERARIIGSLGLVRNIRTLEAFLLAPREEFCRTPSRAYESAAMPIGYGQTISGPHLVARMTDSLNLQPGQKVLEIGTGSGYQAALLAELTDEVYTIEIVEPLARETDGIYRRLEKRYPEYRNVRRMIADGYYGWEERAPFDRIIVTCGIDHIPPELLGQLSPEGIMVIPVGPPSGQTILRVVKHVTEDGEVTLEREDIYHGKRKEIFVPFTSAGGGVHRGDR